VLSASNKEEGGIMLRNTVLEAKDIWTKDTVTGSSWVLQGIRIEILEGDFIAILGGPAAGKSALLKVLSFRESPKQGAVYFEGRLVGRSGAAELEHMCSERVWLLSGSIDGNQINIEAGKRLAAVLIDEPEALLGAEPDQEFLQKIRELSNAGVAVLIATRNPAVASLAPVIYKLNGGKLEKLTGKVANI
jgi:ABC-type lipoprotein export system ATPase subunit